MPDLVKNFPQRMLLPSFMLTADGTTIAGLNNITSIGIVANSVSINYVDGTSSTFGGGTTGATVAFQQVSAALKSLAHLIDLSIGIIGIFPVTGPAAGGTQVSVTGNGFNQGGTLKINGVLCTSLVITPTQITAITPANAAGTYDVAYKDPNSISATLAASFTYV